MKCQPISVCLEKSLNKGRYLCGDNLGTITQEEWTDSVFGVKINYRDL